MVQRHIGTHPYNFFSWKTTRHTHRHLLLYKNPAKSQTSTSIKNLRGVSTYLKTAVNRRYILVYVESIYNYFHDFMSPVEYATMKIEIAIENDRSLKLCQTRQVNVSATPMQPTTNDRHTAHQWAVRRGGSG
jgi:hypothetical protein